MANFCGKCGHRLEPKTGLCPECQKKEIRRVKRGKRLKIIVMLLAVAIIVTIPLLLLGQRYKQEQQDETLPTTCSHVCTEATCTTPKTCILCGEVLQDAWGHVWADATLTIPKTCVYCRQTEGEPQSKPGDFFKLGHYEQDNQTANGAEPIEWIILKVESGRVLAISKDGLDSQKYHNTLESVTWEDCDIRHWLLEDFYNAAFNEAEKEWILQPQEGDMVSILSKEEVDTYRATLDEWTWNPTQYALSRYNAGHVHGKDWWWARLVYGANDQAPCFNTDVGFNATSPINMYESYVRPIIWVDLDAYYQG